MTLTRNVSPEIEPVTSGQGNTCPANQLTKCLVDRSTRRVYNLARDRWERCQSG